MGILPWLRRRAPDVVVDRARFLQEVWRNGLSPLVLHELSGVPDADGELTTALRAMCADIARDNLRRTAELLAVMRALDAAGIDVFTIKGAALAQLAYGSVAMRQFVDLDVVVAPRDVFGATDMLAARGYALYPALSRAQLAVFLRSGHHLSFVHRVKHDVVELHWGLLPRTLAFALDERRARARRRPVIVAGAPLSTLSVEDTILFLAVHGSKHRWHRLSWVCDFAQLIDAHAALDWAQLFDEAAARGGDRMLALAVALAADLLDGRLPPSIDRERLTHPVVQRLVTTVWQRMWEPYDRLRPDDRAFQLATLGRVADKARYCVAWAIGPTHADFAAADLPVSARALYYALRPVRLVAGAAFRPPARRPSSS